MGAVQNHANVQHLMAKVLLPCMSPENLGGKHSLPEDGTIIAHLTAPSLPIAQVCQPQEPSPCTEIRSPDPKHQRVQKSRATVQHLCLTSKATSSL